MPRGYAPGAATVAAIAPATRAGRNRGGRRRRRSGPYMNLAALRAVLPAGAGPPRRRKTGCRVADDRRERPYEETLAQIAQTYSVVFTFPLFLTDASQPVAAPAGEL